MSYYNRRLFLKSSAASFLGGAAALSSLGARQAYASDAGGYKALVCLFLKGGADMFDVLLPRDAASHAAFTALRPSMMASYAGNTRARENLLALNPSNAAQFGTRRFGLAPEFAALHSMFDAGEAALVGSVGPLLTPTSRTEMQAATAALPAKLFSHNDQQSTWMALGTEGTRAGWGGTFMDTHARSGGVSRPAFAAITAGSGDVFLAGEQTTPFKAPRNPDGLDVNLVRQAYLTSGTHGEAARAKLDAYLRDRSRAGRTVFARDVTESQARGIDNMRDYKDAFTTVGPVTTEFPDTPIGKQLAAIANSIHIRSVVGNSRQVFYADMGGYDSHDSQPGEMPATFAQLADALAAFRAAMIETGAWDKVTLFSMSEFGRTLSENGDGTDHGWGSHHFVMGGSVAGGRIYGDLPVLDPDSERFTKTRARLIPSVAVEQYAATLGSWFGLDSGEIDRVLPHLGRFDGRDLGFMGATAV